MTTRKGWTSGFAARLWTMVALAFLFLLGTSAARAQTAVAPAGTGTVSDPYQITELGNLVWMSNDVALHDSTGKCYKLMNDIDASDTANWNDNGTTTSLVGFRPIDSDPSGFTGLFDGQGHAIGGLVVNRPTMEYVGLFGYIGSGGEVRNLTLGGGTARGLDHVGGLVGMSSYGTIMNCYATGAVSGANEVGGLIGYNDSTTVANCHSTGAVSGTSDVGGLVGCNLGTITNCYATGAVSTSATQYVGGLVGYNIGTITNCYASGSVSGGDSSGGLIGCNDGGTIRNCYAKSVVSGSAGVGGLAGENGGASTITNCYATGTVSGGYGVGGIVGSNGDSRIMDCYATGGVTGTGDWIGGLVGRNDDAGTITDCYSTGAVLGTGNVGGLVGFQTAGTVTSSYWDMLTSGQTTSSGGAGRATAQMKRQATFVGWDFMIVWDIQEDAAYPILRSIQHIRRENILVLF